MDQGEQREKNSSFTAFEYAGEGGVLAALWNFSGVFHAGIDVDLRQLPMKQVTVEVCEFFELNLTAWTAPAVCFWHRITGCSW